MSQNNIDMKDLKETGSDFRGETDILDIPSNPKNKKTKKIILAVGILIIAMIGIYLLKISSTRTSGTGKDYINYEVGTRDIVLNLSGTGTLQPADSYTVTTLISGDILNAPFEEGDIVEKDIVLYEFDSSDISIGIEQAELSLNQNQRSHSQKVKSLDSLKIKAKGNGTIIELLVEAGDKVAAGQEIATIRDSALMSLDILFGSDDADSFYIGQNAEVTLEGSFEILNGTISQISGVEQRLEGNMLVKKITIDVQNPGGIAYGQAATAIVGDIACNGSGTFNYKGEYIVTAEVSSEVLAVNVKEGQHVSKDQLIITLDSDSVTNDVANSKDSVRNSELTLESKYDQLENYRIKSPISGTIIEKNYKEGDSLESGKALCTIFDLSYLTMTLNVDELDISKIKVGQAVDVTAEAIPGKLYKGHVTKVNINGNTSNGVTSYPVTIRIDETKELFPGMNVQASIIVSSSKNAVAIPVSALLRGNRVLAKKGENLSKDVEEPGIPEGFSYINIIPGISDGEYIEIKEGLSEGEIITYIEEKIPSSSSFEFGPGATGRNGGEFSAPPMNTNQGGAPIGGGIR